MTATDASEAALEIARGNAAELAAKVEFREGFWWDALVPNSQFDLSSAIRHTFAQMTIICAISSMNRFRP